MAIDHFCIQCGIPCEGNAIANENYTRIEGYMCNICYGEHLGVDDNDIWPDEIETNITSEDD